MDVSASVLMPISHDIDDVMESSGEEHVARSCKSDAYCSMVIFLMKSDLSLLHLLRPVSPNI